MIATRKASVDINLRPVLNNTTDNKKDDDDDGKLMWIPERDIHMQDEL